MHRLPRRHEGAAPRGAPAAAWTARPVTRTRSANTRHRSTAGPGRRGAPTRPPARRATAPPTRCSPRATRTRAVAKRNLAATCGSCHANADFLARHAIPFAHPVEAYERSTHGRAVAAGNDKAPSCSDCHGSHTILPARDPAAAINHWRVPETCGRCHGEIAEDLRGQRPRRGVRARRAATRRSAPTATASTPSWRPREPGSLVNPARVSARHLRPLPRRRAASTPATTCPGQGAGLPGQLPRPRAQAAGSQIVANCASCHGVHNILSSRDPRSTVNPRQLGRTCGECHPGAGRGSASARCTWSAARPGSTRPPVGAPRLPHPDPPHRVHAAPQRGLDFVAKLSRETATTRRPGRGARA